MACAKKRSPNAAFVTLNSSFIILSNLNGVPQTILQMIAAIVIVIALGLLF